MISQRADHSNGHRYEGPIKFLQNSDDQKFFFVLFGVRFFPEKEIFFFHCLSVNSVLNRLAGRESSFVNHRLSVFEFNSCRHFCIVFYFEITCLQ